MPQFYLNTLSTEIYLFLRLGRPVNVTETSSLVEQLIRAEMTVEASEVTRGMLARDTHPLPKIFRLRRKPLISAV